MNEEFMQLLDELRKQYRRPLFVSSGYRCAEHPAEAKKETPGAHNTGRAADLLVHATEAYQLLTLACSLRFTGIGVNQKGDHAQRFLHVDTLIAETHLRPTVWSY